MTEQSLAPAFWDNPKEAEAFMKRLSGVKFWVASIEKLAGEIDDLEVLMEMAAEESAAQGSAARRGGAAKSGAAESATVEGSAAQGGAAESESAPVSEYDKEIEAAAKNVKGILVAEINAGQMVDDVKLAVNGSVPVVHYGRLGGIVPEPEEMVNVIKEKLV